MLKEYGEVNEVCDRYGEYVDYYNSLSSKEKAKIRDKKFEKELWKIRKLVFGKNNWSSKRVGVVNEKGYYIWNIWFISCRTFEYY